MPLSANLLKLESSILPRAKRATSQHNVATEKRIKKKVLAPNGPGAEMSGAEMSSAETYPTLKIYIPIIMHFISIRLICLYQEN